MRRMTAKRGIALLATLILLFGVICFFSPYARTRAFIALYGNEMESMLKAGAGLRAHRGIRHFNVWEGEHDMAEFILLCYGDTYYGCYYSPDDVPLPFQNAGAALSQADGGYWNWTAEGDNHGATKRIKAHWYYFKASF